MQISVFGIGYVGAVVAGCMAGQGHRVIAVDVNRAKIDAINAGNSVVTEPGLDGIVAEARRAGRLSATADTVAAIEATDLSFICVGTPGLANGTPGLANGKLDLSYIVAVTEQIGKLLGDKYRHTGKRHFFVLRSTVLPGTVDNVVLPVLEHASGLKVGVEIGVGYMPEFLREGQGVADFEDPATVVLGASDRATFDVLRELNPTKGQTFECSFATAESVKFANNAWHAAKVTFANEIGIIAKASGVDGRRVMEILCADDRLNISPAYLKPGFAFGGSCLPKDLGALVAHGRAVGADPAMLEAVIASNAGHIARALDMVAATGERRVALLGLTFKPNTDDLRHSPLVELAERLVGKGYDLKIFDPSFSYETIFGRNRQFINTALPHLATLLVNSLDDALAHGRAVVVGHRTELSASLMDRLTDGQTVIDLAGALPTAKGLPNYVGICW